MAFDELFQDREARINEIHMNILRKEGRWCSDGRSGELQDRLETEISIQLDAKIDEVARAPGHGLRYGEMWRSLSRAKD